MPFCHSITTAAKMTIQFEYSYSNFLVHFRIVGLDEASGAQTTLFCALEESIQQETGKYYDNCREKEPGTALARDDHMSAELWDATLSSLRQNGYLH